MSYQDRRCKILSRLSSLSMGDVASFDELLSACGGSGQATLYRDLKNLRKEFGDPIEFAKVVFDDKKKKGYRLKDPDFDPPECRQHLGNEEAFQIIESLLDALNDNELLGPSMRQLLDQVREEQQNANHAQPDLPRVRVISLAAHQRSLDRARAHFPVIGQALLGMKRQCLTITYHSKYKAGDPSVRTVSPQQLVLYRGNWYLLAWCHLRKGLRTFGLDSITEASLSEEKYHPVEARDLKTALGTSYGIFPTEGVADRHRVTLVFSEERARWVSQELWHPKQQATLLEDGRWKVEFPYADDRELIMDILRHVPEVEVESPQELRRKVAEMLAAGLKKFSDDGA